MLEGLKTFSMIHYALASSTWPPEKLQRIQEDRLRKLIIHAYHNVPLYRTLYDENDFHPEMFRALDDLDQIPILTKARLKAACRNEVVATGSDLNRCQTVKTSGSTGIPLHIYLGPYEQRWQRAVAWRILFEHGYHWTDRTLEIRMALGKKFYIQRLGLAQKDWISVLEPPEHWARYLVEKQHDILVASPSTLNVLAETIDGLKLDVSPPRIIVSDSECLTPSTRRFVQNTLGTDPVDIYGLVEFSNFAWECEHRHGFHVSADSHIVEVAATPGQPGPIIATGLGMWTMPIIRYDTGDMAEVSSEKCPCGRTLPLLKHIYGRSIDSVVLPHGKRLFWQFFHEFFANYNELQQWRVIQHDILHVNILLVIDHIHRNILGPLETNLRRALPEDLRFTIELVDRIPIKPGEKTRMVISHISNSI
jgi:phenylacetate-CoA ligase